MSAWEGSAWQAAQEAEREKQEREKLSGVARKIAGYHASDAKKTAQDFSKREAERVAREEAEGRRNAQTILERVIFGEIRKAAQKGDYIVRLSDYQWSDLGCGSHYLIEELKEYGYRAEVTRPCMDPGTEYIIRWD